MEAKYYQKLSDNSVQCFACHHRCVITDDSIGKCGVRLNLDGTLYALNYGKTIAAHIDPIEKKPLYRFLSKTKTYSLATVGCNFRCPWCQNHDISQIKYVGFRLPGNAMDPLDHVKQAVKANVDSISYTYTEPTVFIEYALDIMTLAHDMGLKNIFVTNGFMSDEVLDDVIPLLDAANVDYKGSGDSVYEEYTSGSSEKVLKNIKRLHEAGVHVEVTTLVVPSVNDSDEQLERIAYDIASISPSIPWHISRYFPNYKFTSIRRTPIDTMQQAYRFGVEAGLEHIYLGNV